MLVEIGIVALRRVSVGWWVPFRVGVQLPASLRPSPGSRSNSSLRRAKLRSSNSQSSRSHTMAQRATSAVPAWGPYRRPFRLNPGVLQQLLIGAHSEEKQDRQKKKAKKNEWRPFWRTYSIRTPPSPPRYPSSRATERKSLWLSHRNRATRLAAIRGSTRSEAVPHGD